MASRDGVEFYMIRNWTQHQHYKNKRPTWIKVYTHLLTDMKFRSMCDSSKLLLFHLWLLAATNGNKIRLEMCNLRSITGISNRKLDPSELIENNYLVPYDSRLALDGVYTREEKRREEHIKKRREEKRPQTPFDSKAFNLFWSTYPKKVGKGAARKSWEKLKPDTMMVGAIIKAVENQKRSPQWMSDGGRFIPNPSTWLNQERWSDQEVETPDDGIPQGSPQNMAVLRRAIQRAKESE